MDKEAIKAERRLIAKEGGLGVMLPEFSSMDEGDARAMYNTLVHRAELTNTDEGYTFQEIKEWNEATGTSFSEKAWKRYQGIWNRMDKVGKPGYQPASRKKNMKNSAPIVPSDKDGAALNDQAPVVNQSAAPSVPTCDESTDYGALVGQRVVFQTEASESDNNRSSPTKHVNQRKESSERRLALFPERRLATFHANHELDSHLYVIEPPIKRDAQIDKNATLEPPNKRLGAPVLSTVDTPLGSVQEVVTPQEQRLANKEAPKEPGLALDSTGKPLNGKIRKGPIVFIYEDGVLVRRERAKYKNAKQPPVSTPPQETPKASPTPQKQHKTDNLILDKNGKPSNDAVLDGDMINKYHNGKLVIRMPKEQYKNLNPQEYVKMVERMNKENKAAKASQSNSSPKATKKKTPPSSQQNVTVNVSPQTPTQREAAVENAGEYYKIGTRLTKEQKDARKNGTREQVISTNGQPPPGYELRQYANGWRYVKVSTAPTEEQKNASKPVKAKRRPATDEYNPKRKSNKDVKGIRTTAKTAEEVENVLGKPWNGYAYKQCKKADGTLEWRHCRVKRAARGTGERRLRKEYYPNWSDVDRQNKSVVPPDNEYYRGVFSEKQGKWVLRAKGTNRVKLTEVERHGDNPPTTPAGEGREWRKCGQRGWCRMRVRTKLTKADLRAEDAPAQYPGKGKKWVKKMIGKKSKDPRKRQRHKWIRVWDDDDPDIANIQQKIADKKAKNLQKRKTKHPSRFQTDINEDELNRLYNAPREGWGWRFDPDNGHRKVRIKRNE